jgi:hypothetical protein
MYLVDRVGTLKPLVIETVDRSKVAKVWQAYFGQGHTPRRGLRRWRVRLSSSRIDDALSVRASTEMEQLAPHDGTYPPNGLQSSRVKWSNVMPALHAAAARSN